MTTYSDKFLTIEDLQLQGKRAFLRIDINSVIDPKTGRLMDLGRIKEAAQTIRDLSHAKVVAASHQGRVGRYDYVSLEEHSKALSEAVGKQVKFVPDILGPAAMKEISSLNTGEVLLLDNLRFMAEENMEFTPEAGAQTILVQRLSKHFDACVLDAFPTAHRAHPSIVGFSHLLPTCGGRLVIKELKSLNRVMTVAKGPYTAVLGGAKVSDRLEAIETLVANKKADKVLLGGMIGNVFLRAAHKISSPLGIEAEDKTVQRAAALMENYPGVFEIPLDVALEKYGERVEVDVNTLEEGTKPLDIGSRTIDHYCRIIKGSGTLFMSGPPGFFEDPRFATGTYTLLKALASSFGTTIVSGGHLTAALQQFGIRDSIDYISTSGGALVLYLAGRRLPMIEALRAAAERFQR